MNLSVNEEVSFDTTTAMSWLSENISNKSFNGSEQEIVEIEGNLSKPYPQCNKTIYFICPDPDPLLQACASITLQSELQTLVTWKWWFFGVFGSILIGCGLLGNIMAIVVLSRPQMQSAFNQLLIALCFFDSIFLVVSVSEVGTSLELSPFKWKYANYTALVSMCTSVFMMVALTLERHFAICSPHAYRIHIRTTARCKHLAMYIVPVLVLANFFNVPMLLNIETQLLKNPIYVKINLYLRALHPLTTTGIAPMAILIILNRRILKGMKVLNNTSRRPPHQSQEPSFISNAAQERSQRRHMNEIRTTHMAIAIVISFAVLNLPRIAISAKEVTNTNLIINCVENKRKFFPSLQYYQIDIIARTFMMVNSAINFVIYSAVSHPFQETFCRIFCPTSFQKIGCCTWRICCQGSDDPVEESNVENGLNDELPNINELRNSDENGSRSVKRENQLVRPQLSAISQTGSTIVD